MPDHDEIHEDVVRNLANDRLARLSRWVGLFGGLFFLVFALFIALEAAGT